MILFINACVRSESRTKQLADYLISMLDDPVTEHRLSQMDFPFADEEFLVTRESLIESGDLSHPSFCTAREFAAADTIVIAAPYWDLSFPAELKRYLELISVPGVTFRYSSDGVPVGLCKAKKLYYVTTAGGCYVPTEYGFGYVRELANTFYGIPDVMLIKAVGLDIDGAEVDTIMADCKSGINALFIWEYWVGRIHDYLAFYSGSDRNCISFGFLDEVISVAPDHYSGVNREYFYRFDDEAFHTCLSHWDGGNFTANREYNDQVISTEEFLAVLESKQQSSLKMIDPSMEGVVNKDYAHIRDELIAFVESRHKDN